MTRCILMDWDPNVRVAGNRYYMHADEIPPDMDEGDDVLLVESESGLNAPARVSLIDSERGLVYFTVSYSQTEAPPMWHAHS